MRPYKGKSPETPINLTSYAQRFPDAYLKNHITETDMFSTDLEKSYAAWLKFATEFQWFTGWQAKENVYWKIRYEYYKRSCNFNSVDALNDPDPRISNLAKNYGLGHLSFDGYKF